MNWQQWLKQASRRLCGSVNFNAKHDAEILLAHVTSATRPRLLAFGETILTEAQHSMLEAMFARREQGEPIAYITGEREFWSLPLRVSTDTLIPRPDTECLVQSALDLFSFDQVEVLDLGTGTGAIALALASERPAWRITGVDRLQGAVALARYNAERLMLSNVHFYVSDWYQTLNIHCYSLIVSNPPYIDANDQHLTQGDLRFEPRSALVSGENGLKDLAAICNGLGSHLLPGGWLILEHGWRQGAAVRNLLADAGLENISTIRDYNNNERVSKGQRLPK